MANKKQIKKDMSKEAMYRKIMPSTPTPDQDTEELIEAVYKEATGDNQHFPCNVMELIVQSKITLIMDKLGACTCEQCYNDCLALALNKLPAIYSGSDRDSIQEKVLLIRADYEVKVTSAIIRAVQAVMAQPRH